MKKTIFIFFIFFLVHLSCKKKPTTWQSSWTAPLAHGELSMNQWVNDSTISSNGSSLSLDFNRTILNVGLQDLISIPDTTINQTVSPALSLTIPPGFNIVNEIEEHTMEIPGVELKKIRVSNGTIDIDVYNPLSTPTTYSVNLPGVSKNGVEYSNSYLLPPGTSSNPSLVSESIDLSGYEIDLKGKDGISYNKLQSKLVVMTDANGSSVSVDPSFEFKVEASINNLIIDYAQGYFGNQVFSDSISYEVPYLNKIVGGLVDFPSTSIELKIDNSMKVGFSSSIDHVSNINYSNSLINLQSNYISNPIYLAPATGSWNAITPSSSSLFFNSSNSNIEAFMENLGHRQNISMSYELNPWGNTNGGWDEIFSNSKINLELKVQMPLNIGLNNLQLKDTFSFKMDPKINPFELKDAVLNLKTRNAFPFSCRPVISLLDENKNLLYSLVSNDSIISSLYGTIDPIDGIQKMESLVQFYVSEEMVKDLSNVKYVEVNAVFNSIDPQTNLNSSVLIPVDAFISFKLTGDFNLINSY